jgi:two-component system NtrC family response regulator
MPGTAVDRELISRLAAAGQTGPAALAQAVAAEAGPGHPAIARLQAIFARDPTLVVRTPRGGDDAQDLIAWLAGEMDAIAADSADWPPDLLGILCLAYGWLLGRCAPGPTAEDLWQRLHDLVQTLAPRFELPAHRMLPAHLALLEIDPKRNELLRHQAAIQLIASLPPGSELREAQLSWVETTACLAGLGCELQERPQRSCAGDPVLTARQSRMLDFLDRSQRLDPEAAGCGLSSLLADLAAPAWEGLVQLHHLAMQAMLAHLGRSQIAAGPLAEAADAIRALPAARSYPGIAEDAGLVLRAHQPDAADLDLLVRRFADPVTSILGCSDHLLFSLYMRVLLGNRRTAEVRRILEQRRRHARRHWLDPFFLARLLLLEGDGVGARHAFGEALGAAAWHRAGLRLDYELRASPELGAAVLSGLVAGSDAAPVHQPSASPEPGAHGLVGPSAAMTLVRDLVGRFAPSPLAVLISGPTGSGKELVAHALHAASPRSRLPFVAINCSALPEHLIASELFGHARGAFTGADRERSGLVAEAGEGTLFLDEIGETSAAFQASLLRLLEEGEYRPVGANAVRRCRARIVAATNIGLGAAVEAGRFRRDLYHRLRRLAIPIPALAERVDDIVPLAVHFLVHGTQPGRPVAQLSLELAAHLRSLPWPGNVRELRNHIERMLILAPDVPALGLTQYARAAQDEAVEPPRPIAPPARPDSSLRRFELLADLFRTHRRLTRREVARHLGIAPGTATVYLRRMRDQGLIRKVAPSGAPSSQYFELDAPPTRDG